MGKRMCKIVLRTFVLIITSASTLCKVDISMSFGGCISHSMLIVICIQQIRDNIIIITCVVTGHGHVFHSR